MLLDDAVGGGEAEAGAFALFFSGEESEEYIGEVMLQALLDENILSVYYAYSKRGVLASTGECEACQ